MARRIVLPEFHADQLLAWELSQTTKRMALRAGRRWGKTAYGIVDACDLVAYGEPIGWFSPDYKISAETFSQIADYLDPIRKSSSKVEGVIKCIGGGRVDFWTLNNPRAGRSRKYRKVYIDEGAFTGGDMMDIWEQAIEPTLLDLDGDALVMSNTNGNDPANFFWRICNEREHGFTEFHAPTRNNPFMPQHRIEQLKREKPPLVFAQEYEAEFVDWTGIQFFDEARLRTDPEPVAFPGYCDAVYATIDSAVKTGKEHDGTAVIFWALCREQLYPLFVLDWDYVQIEGALLETWLPSVFARLEELARACNARMGSVGAWIEDKASGMILLQQASNRGWNAHAIDSVLTSLGKDERAINISGYVYTGKVKISDHAYYKTSIFKTISRNHMLSQILSFRVGDKDNKRADDLLDCFCYGVAIGIGDWQGI